MMKMKKLLQKLRFIGFYDYTVILTYLSLAAAVLGMAQAIHGHYKTAIFYLAFAGICDAFDGRVARSKKNRTEDEKAFGIQLDSLCDVISFGVFPAMICYLLGVRGIVGSILVAFYCICAVIRLAFFNVLEAKRQQAEGEGSGNKVYHGLPGTSMAFILPLMFWIQFLVPEMAFIAILHVLLPLVGFLFILDFPMKKPSLKQILAMICVVAVTVGIIFGFTKYRVPRQDNENNPIVEELIGEFYEDETP